TGAKTVPAPPPYTDRGFYGTSRALRSRIRTVRAAFGTATRAARLPLCAEELARAAERHQREVVAVEVVVDHEPALQLGALGDSLARLLVAEIHASAESVAGKTGARVVGLVPRSVVALRVDEESDPAADRAFVLSIVRSNQREQRPSRLRRRARPAPAQGVVHVRRARLAPAAVGVLMGDEPFGGRAYVRLRHVLADRGERRQHGRRAINMIDAPAAEPAAVRFLLRADELEPARDGRVIEREAE